MLNLRKYNLDKTIPYLITLSGLVGFWASFELALAEISNLIQPDKVLNCSINPIISCGSVMSTSQASIFGFSNSFLGIAAFASVATIGMALLAGASFKKWFWQGLQLGTIFGLVIVHYLFFQTVYRIGALCPYCMVIWAATIPLFWYVTLYNFRKGFVKTPAKAKTLVSFVQKHHGTVLLIWFLAIIGLILEHFWYYWSTLL